MQEAEILTSPKTTGDTTQEEDKPSSSAVKKEILTLIAICGEIPRDSIKWLGDEEQTMKAIYNATGVLKVSGAKGISIKGSRTKKSRGELLFLKHLKKISEPAANYWFSVYGTERTRTEINRVYRAHKIARTVILLRSAGINCCPWDRDTVSDQFFPAKEIKSKLKEITQDDKNAQNVGILKIQDEAYIVFNFHGVPKRIDERIEKRFKVSGALFLDSFDNGNHTIEKELIISSCEVMAEYLLQQQKKSIVDFVQKYYLPYDRKGATILQCWQIKDWEEKITNLEFPEHVRIKNNALFNAEQSIDQTSVQRAATWYNLNVAKLIAIISEAKSRPNNKYLILAFSSTSKLIEMMAQGIDNIQIIVRNEEAVLRSISTE